MRLWTHKGYNGPFTPHWGYRGHRKRRGMHVPGPRMSNMGFSHSKCHFQDVLIQCVLRVVSVNSFRIAPSQACTIVWNSSMVLWRRVLGQSSRAGGRACQVSPHVGAICGRACQVSPRVRECLLTIHINIPLSLFF